MKKFFITFLLMFCMTVSYAQPQNFNFFNRIDFSKFEFVDSLPLERIMIHFEKEISEEEIAAKNLIDLKSGYYLAPIPFKDNFVVKYNADKSKAIVIRNSYAFGRHYEFNVKDEERRTVFWYKDNDVYCGYIYDKEFKVTKYFDSKKQYNRFMRHRPMFRTLSPLPRRNYEKQ